MLSNMDVCGYRPVLELARLPTLPYPSFYKRGNGDELTCQLVEKKLTLETRSPESQ